MSHFLTIVLVNQGDDVEKNVEQLLAPFHEFECTGIDDQYVQNVDVTDKYRGYHAEYAKGKGTLAEYIQSDGIAVLEAGSKPTDDHKYGWVELDAGGEVVRCIKRTNPNYKWDWYVIGGRWDRYLVGERTRGSDWPHEGPSNTGGNVVPVRELRDDLKAFAFVTPDGEWIERGRMGWWGMVADEKDDAAWSAVCKNVLAKHRECIAVAVDCHI